MHNINWIIYDIRIDKMGYMLSVAKLKIYDIHERNIQNASKKT